MADSGLHSRVRLATLADIPALSASVARAFVDDPMATFPFGSADVETRLRQFFAAFESEAVARGWLWTIDAAGAALWFPPGSETGFQAMSDLAGPLVVPDDADELAIADLDAFWSWIGTHHPDGPHWYLDHLAVDSAHRGTGIGSALLQVGLSRAAEDGVPAFLITDKSNNVPYYEARGFAVASEGISPVGGPHCWFMRADP